MNAENLGQIIEVLRKPSEWILAIYEEIGKILGLDVNHKFVIIGAGNLGQALANYSSFENSGFVLAGIFDVNPVLKGTSIRGVPIRMMDELKTFIEEHQIEIAVLTVPKQNATEVADLLADTTIKGIMNFAHTDLKLPKQMIVENVHVSDSLMKLSYKIGREPEGILEE